MKSLFSIKSLIISAVVLLPATSVFANQTTEQIIEKHLKSLTSDSRFQGISVGVVDKGKSTIVHAGTLTPDGNKSPNDKTLYEIASVTKTMVGLVAARAVIEEKINLDENINKYLKKPLNKLSTQANPLTVRNLVTHTSGLPNLMWDLDEYKEDMTKKELLAAMDNTLYTKGRGNFVYSNVAPDLLAAVLEDVYQQPFESLFKDTLKKLGNIDDISLTLNPTDKGRFAYGYNDKQEPMKAYDGKPQFWGAAGRAKASMPELVRYIQMQLNQSNPIIHESQKQLYRSPTGNSLGYMWQRMSNDDGVFYQHHGGLYGSQNWMLVYPNYNLGISIVANVSFGSVGQQLRDVADAIVDDIKPFGKKSIRLAIKQQCLTSVDNCLKTYNKLKQTKANTYNFNDESQLNSLGYNLLSQEKVDEAIKVFRLLVKEFPQAANPWDSLAEGYLIQDNKACALKYYQKTLTMNRSNPNANKVVTKLTAKRVDAGDCQF